MKTDDLEFKEFYNFPLMFDKFSKSHVWTSDSNLAFEFDEDKEFSAKLSGQEKELIVKVINEENVFLRPKAVLRIKNGTYITADDKPFLSIRGWGNLTGIGGHNLTEEKAAKIQNDFINFILDKLSK